MRSILTTAGELAGIGLITIGIGLFCVPAALIFLGLAIGFASYWIGR
jgi:hypothetical protein